VALINTIYEAIDQRRLLSLVYNGETRTVEPYIVGYTDKNKLLLSAVQRSGGSGNGFRSFDVEEISEVTKMDRRFRRIDPAYNPHDPLFAHILRQV
jgi:predicted DNA-binding transcriptional regulator YafY